MLLESNNWLKILVPVVIIVLAAGYYSFRAGRYRRRLFILGYISSLWRMRFLRRENSDSCDSVAGSYYGLMGHTRSVSSVLTGRQRDVPLKIFDYRYELGSRVGRQVLKKTVVMTQSLCENPPILILYDKSILPFGRFSEYHKLNLNDHLSEIAIKPEIRSYLSKCNVYCSDPNRVLGLFNEKLLSQLSRLKTVDIEFFGDKIILWSDLVVSKYLLIQYAARAIGCTRTINSIGS